MKKILQKIVIVWASVAALVGFQKKESKEGLNDAVRLPDLSEKNVVEDYEMAAYHQQAWFVHQVSTDFPWMVELTNISFGKLRSTITFATRVEPGFFMPATQ